MTKRRKNAAPGVKLTLSEAAFRYLAAALLFVLMLGIVLLVVGSR